MKIKEWMIAVAVAIASALVGYGTTSAMIGNLRDDVRDIKTWKDRAIEQMGNMDGKLDALLQANGVSYRPKKK